ncbi:glutathione S-transferase [Limibaculum sp. M0105]|uniref:Glutathione S-transferase n=1 Tax=Thermohalobaculum xanthum TaxID=2753746 RepID=A0A8J7SEI5_9RHOB|nr:glutathione S-transferase [Thermohalobaculum xanthum]MBK0399838.1 glutathione S-transferase [Thermohalobaculum xanthum]
MTASYRIVIAQKAYSSWSMRGWLLLAAFGLGFEERLVRLYTPEFEAMQRDLAPARTVPILEITEGARTVRLWDSLAIAETLAERHPDAGIWPADPDHRALARSLAAEMHAGFQMLRGACPMNLHRRGRALAAPPDGLDADLARLAELWTHALAVTGGPWLGGAAFSAADVFFAPVATRLESYALLTSATEPYARRLLAHPAVARWIADGRDDPERIARYEAVG